MTISMNTAITAEEHMRFACAWKKNEEGFFAAYDPNVKFTHYTNGVKDAELEGIKNFRIELQQRFFDALVSIRLCSAHVIDTDGSDTITTYKTDQVMRTDQGERRFLYDVRTRNTYAQGEDGIYRITHSVMEVGKKAFEEMQPEPQNVSKKKRRLS